MSNPAGAPDLALLPYLIAFVGWLVGMYWIHRITKDIEDNWPGCPTP